MPDRGRASPAPPPLLHAREYGAPDGRPVVALHGTPGSRLKYAAAGPAAARLGVRLIAVDRWGYGRTGVPEQPSFRGFATAVARLADDLGLATFGLVGISGGGPFAAGVAAHLAPRVDRLALVSPLGPVDGLSRADLRLTQAFCFSVLPHLPWLTNTAMAAFRLGLRRTPRLALAAALLASAPADKALIADPVVRDGLVTTFREALALRVDGPAVDLDLFTRPWDFDLAAITATTRVWLGTEDRNVPAAAARRYVGGIPGATLQDLSGCGHFWIAADPTSVLGWLAR